MLLPGSIMMSELPSFLQSIKDSIPPSEAYLYVYINWSLAQVHKQSSLWLF